MPSFSDCAIRPRSPRKAMCSSSSMALNVRFAPSLRNVEDLLHECGIEVSHETVRFWWQRFGPMFAVEIRTNRRQVLRSVSR